MEWLSAHGGVCVWGSLPTVGYLPRRGPRPDFLGERKLADARRSRAAVVLFGLRVLAQLSWSSASWAWTLEGHRLIALDALAVLPPPTREALVPHVSAILAGVIEPDFNRVVSHKIQIISLRGMPPPPRSGAAGELKRLAANAQEMLRLGRGLDEVLFVQGQATHLVQDLNQPLHAAWARPVPSITRSRPRCFTAPGSKTTRAVASCWSRATHASHMRSPRIPRNMRGRSSLTERSSESRRSRGTRPSMTRPIYGNRSLCTPWGQSGLGSFTGSRRR